MTEILGGKVAIVTGGTSGIGRACVERFVCEGAKVLVADIQDEAGAALADRLGDAVAYVHVDVTVESDIEAAVAGAVERFGRLDIFVNNAGMVGDPAPITEIGEDGFAAVMALDTRSVLWGHKHAARRFIAQGGGGAIVTTASVAAIQGGWSTVCYTTAKHAVMGIIRHAAKELAPHRIRSNAVAPGVIMTPIQARAYGVPVERAADLSRFIDEKLGSAQAMGRFGTVEDVAAVTTFLASDMAAYVSGVAIPVDGGMSAITQNTFDEDVKAVTKEFLAQADKGDAR